MTDEQMMEMLRSQVGRDADGTSNIVYSQILWHPSTVDTEYSCHTNIAGAQIFLAPRFCQYSYYQHSNVVVTQMWLTHKCC